MIKLLAHLMGTRQVPEDFVEKDEEGVKVLHSAATASYFVPRTSMEKLAQAAPGSLKTLLTRRLASLREWQHQPPAEQFAAPSPVSWSMMHRVRYPLVSGLSFLRNATDGIWITEKELAKILIHDPSIEGVVSADGAKAKKAVKKEGAAKELALDDAGNEVESGVGGMPVEKGQKGTVTKVWIIPGCIVCDLCEEKSPDVFHVTETTSTIQMASQASWSALSTSIVEAAVACPVDVIKYELKAAG